MTHFEIEITRIVEWKAAIIVEARDENDAYPIVEARVKAGTIILERTDDHTEIGPVRRVQ